MTTTSNTQSRVSSIQGLRAIAVLAVLLFHVGAKWLPGGFLGVDIFFVISGFVIYRSIKKSQQEEQFSLSSFYQQRAWRLLPALAATLTISALIFGYITPPQVDRTIPWNAITATFAVSNFHFRVGTDYFDSGISNPFIHTWSLGVEEQFYLVFPAIMLASSLFLNRSRTNFLVFGLLISSLAISIWMTADNKADAFYLPWSRAWEFLAGAMLASLSPERIKGSTAEIMSFIGAALIFACLAMFRESYPFPGIGAIPAVLGTTLLIAGILRPGIISRLLSARPLVALGDMSYSLYLVHWPIICLTGMFLNGALKSEVQHPALID